jgi:hypothetical protein
VRLAPAPAMTRLAFTAAFGLACAIACAGGCDVASTCEPAELTPLEDTPTLAVVTSLFRESSAIALLGGKGSAEAAPALLTEAWVDSGSTSPSATSQSSIQGLSGDVVLPTDPVPGELVILERLGADLLTRIAVPSGEVLAQYDLEGGAEPSAPAYRANPQDALRLPDGDFLVSRHEPNFDDGAGELRRGNDLVFIDAKQGRITERLALDAFNVTADGDAAIYARPGRMTWRADRIVVGLARLDRRFEKAGPGAVLVVDWPSRAIHLVELAGLTNCGIVAPVPGSDSLTAVLCAGTTFSKPEERRAEAGLALVDTSGATPTVTTILRAADHPAMPPPQLGLVSIDAGRVAFLSLSLDAERTDALVLADLRTGESAVIGRYPLRGDDALLGFNLGPGVWVPETGLLVVPSATDGALCFSVASGLDTEALEPKEVSPCRRLPAREIARLVP